MLPWSRDRNTGRLLRRVPQVEPLSLALLSASSLSIDSMDPSHHSGDNSSHSSHNANGAQNQHLGGQDHVVNQPHPVLNHPNNQVDNVQHPPLAGQNQGMNHQNLPPFNLPPGTYQPPMMYAPGMYPPAGYPYPAHNMYMQGGQIPNPIPMIPPHPVCMNQGGQVPAAPLVIPQVAPQGRTLRDYLHPERQSTPSCVVLPPNHLAFTCRPQMLQIIPKFHSMDSENPYHHIKEFEDICSTFVDHEYTDETVKLKLFPFSLKDKAKH